MTNAASNFTVLVERRLLRLACIFGIASLAACGGGGNDSMDEMAAEPPSVNASKSYSAPVRTPDARTSGIVLSEKVRGGIVLSESIVEDVESNADEGEHEAR